MVKLCRKNNVNEAKQVGLLYHCCSAQALLYNLKNNSITPGIYSNWIGNSPTISFTRDKRYVVDTTDKDLLIFQMVIDGDTLSEHTKVLPFSAPGYSDKESEKEEVILDGLKNLRKYLKGVNVFVNIQAMVYGDGSFKNKLFSKEDLQALEQVKKLGLPCSIQFLGDRRVNVPRNLDGVIEMVSCALKFDPISFRAAILSYCNIYFPSSDLTEVSVSNRLYQTQVRFNSPTPVTYFKDEIKTLVEIIQEEIGAQNFLVTEDKPSKETLKRHGNKKLDTVLRNNSYMIMFLDIDSSFNYLTNQTPYVHIQLLNANGAVLHFYIYFPVDF